MSMAHNLRNVSAEQLKRFFVMAKEKLQGKIGVTTENIFPVIKQFLYSDHEIFLRELVANAVDATRKLKVLASNGEFKGELGELKVEIALDEKKNETHETPYLCTPRFHPCRV